MRCVQGYNRDFKPLCSLRLHLQATTRMSNATVNAQDTSNTLAEYEDDSYPGPYPLFRTPPPYNDEPYPFRTPPPIRMKNWLLKDAYDLSDPLLNKLQVAAFDTSVRSDTKRVTNHITYKFNEQDRQDAKRRRTSK